MIRKKKPTMRIGMAGRNVTYSGNYAVNWGASGRAYNKNVKHFKKRTSAIKFKDQLVRKHKKKYQTKYMYLAD